MGSFIGHAVPGVMFTVASIWWLVGSVRLSFLQLASKRNRPLLKKTRRRGGGYPYRVVCGCMGRCTSNIPLEALIKVALSMIGVLGELLYEKQWILIDDNGFMEQHLNNYAHASMYSMFGLSGVVDVLIHFNVAPLPTGLDRVFLSLAFFVEGMLFFFHLGGRPELAVHIHTFIYMLSFLTSLVLLIEIKAETRTSIPSFARAFLTSLQGTWFFQTAFVLHGSCPWKSSSENVEFLVIAFVWHVFVLAVLYLAIFVIVYRCLFSKRLRQETVVENGDSADDEQLS